MYYNYYLIKEEYNEKRNELEKLEKKRGELLLVLISWGIVGVLYFCTTLAICIIYMSMDGKIVYIIC